jgi:hypothetical protein
VHTEYWWGNVREIDHLRSRRRWEGNLKMDPQEVGFGGTDWIDLAGDKDRCRILVNAVMNLRVP